MDGSAEKGARVALVTGGIRGLGLACARALAAGGVRTHVTWVRSADRARSLEEDFEGRVHRADLADAAACEAVVEAVLARDGRLDHLVHAVGDYASGPLAELEPEELDHLLANNVGTAFRMVRAARAALRDRGGRIVLFGCAGLAGLRARRECAAYAAAKSALVVLARSLAVEEAPHGVTVNVVSPGMVPHDAAHPDTLAAGRALAIPAGRAGRPEDVAGLVRWLCSDEAGYTTGSDVQVAGGWML